MGGSAAREPPKFLFVSREPMNTKNEDYKVIEHALQHLMWAEQKKFATLLAKHALTLPQFLVLTVIRQHGAGCPIGAIAEEMFQSYPTMTGIVDRLEDARLVVRERGSAADRRQVVVNLTPDGAQLLDRARAARQERMLRALAHFSANDRREFLRLLTTYFDALEKEPA